MLASMRNAPDISKYYNKTFTPSPPHTLTLFVQTIYFFQPFFSTLILLISFLILFLSLFFFLILQHLVFIQASKVFKGYDLLNPSKIQSQTFMLLLFHLKFHFIYLNEIDKFLVCHFIYFRFL